MNRNYQRSANRERTVKLALEGEGWFAMRASGSHGIADVVAIRPRASRCGDPGHFEVRFIQIKVSTRLKKRSERLVIEETPFGPVNVEYWSFPVRARGGAR